jgi:dienelactone hydrolase
MRLLVAFLVSGVLGLVTVAAYSQSPSTYTELFYPSGGVRIQAYLYKPDGDGPFPMVIYNHGSRVGREWDSLPFEYIGALLSHARYAVLVPERSGYGRSDGLSWPEAVGNDKGRFVRELHEETDDVLAGVDYLRTLPFVDPKRIGIMGWSFGGIVTMFAVSRSTTFAVAIKQAGGALTWNGNAEVRSAHRRRRKGHDANAVAGGRKRPYDRLHHHARGDLQEARCGASDGDLWAVSASTEDIRQRGARTPS